MSCSKKTQTSSALAAILFSLTAFLQLVCANSGPADAGSGKVSVEGLVTPEHVIDLAAASEGPLLEVLVKEGAFVSKGQPVASLTQEEENIQLRQAELAARQLEEDLQSTRRLFEEKAASRDDLNRATLSAGRAAAERDLLAIRLRNRTVTSPVDGRVLRLLKDPGESVQRLEKVAEIVSFDRKFLTAYADARYFGKIQPGAPVAISASNGENVPAKVEVVDPVLDAGGRVFRVKILAEDSANLLAVGSRVSASIELQ